MRRWAGLKPGGLDFRLGTRSGPASVSRVLECNKLAHLAGDNMTANTSEGFDLRLVLDQRACSRRGCAATTALVGSWKQRTTLPDMLASMQPGCNRHFLGHWGPHYILQMHAPHGGGGRTAVTVATLTPQGWMMVSAFCSSSMRMAPAWYASNAVMPLPPRR